MPATQYTNEYRFELRRLGDITSTWVETTEEFVCKRLARETPDPRDLNDILIAMRNGDQADACDGRLVFRAVPAADRTELRVVYTTAPAAYDGFGTVELVQVAGHNRSKMVVRKVGIRPEHFEWQTQRYGSGMYLTVAEDLVLGGKYADIWTMVG